ncbi:cob(I)alamin adenosyltransferase [Alkalihalobacillus xiaoxiensis]|uniref:Corrinoid adenosyltransferase n=1 Tax=Shouchella xiaoxiensis TaxID=766895 RepID=A0ABS2SRZ6_9BACI|nr:cob(I)yrinic acid a,c-diamide adenosyltransferase [Shouchella xiaoxiensis]MBM7838266.1 cob(I)alamin adenosyltransferase [Shouchella xiaoxiensis]
MKIYTKGGDKGETSVLGARVKKTDVRIDAIGAIDELNSSLGMSISIARTEGLDQLAAELVVLSHQLFDLGADLANINNTIPLKIVPAYTEAIEHRIDVYTELVGPLTRFILPGGSHTAGALHRCRTDTRRAERILSSVPNVPQAIGPYINRLSDYFFTVARLANKELDVDDVFYEGRKTVE